MDKMQHSLFEEEGMEQRMTGNSSPAPLSNIWQGYRR